MKAKQWPLLRRFIRAQRTRLIDNKLTYSTLPSPSTEALYRIRSSFANLSKNRCAKAIPHLDLNDRLNCLRILNLHFYKYLKFSRFSHLFNLSPFKRPVCLILTCSAFRAVQSAPLLIIGEIVKVNIFERLSLEWIFRFLQLDLHL